MNRKERRAAGKRRDESAKNAPAFASAGVSIADLAVEASRFYGMRRFNESQQICRQILAREPGHVQGLNLLGLLAQASGDHRAAAKAFAKAIAADDVNAACHYNAGNSYQALGNRSKAAAHFSKALALGMDAKAVGFILQSPVVTSYAGRIASKWPLPVTSSELFGSEGVAPLARDLFLRSAMEATTLASMQLEVLLGYARAELLQLAGEQGQDEVDDEIVAFACALARQCFINEYVYAQTAAESEGAGALRDRLLQDLTSGAAISPLTLAVVAAYFPLHALPAADALLRLDWPATVAGLLRVQLREPRVEMEERSAIAGLTPIKNSVSVDVMRQYEENPYPRWTVNPLTAFAADRARGRTVATADQQAERDILIAGCGTGSHAIQIAQVYPNARLLAVDISMTSLAYARRKTRELGLRNIDYAQADILELGSIGRTFDSIESVGVLHHLAEPLSGWRVLVSLLRPGGTMRIGLYSHLARRVIVEARDRIAARNYRATTEDIRRCRQDIFREADKWKPLIGAKDFYSMSGCRDLLFNVMEHRLTIPEIAAFLSEHGLTFGGFEPFDDPAVLDRFRKQFPGTADETDLDQWHRFELDHPETFWDMYVFMVGKSAR
ncbi:class I SAM-dependent methyltransferase [Bradyrhizobium elkanii]|uniref:class I SAM-dependent methyltransferase n=1 Tax=Bradyrhizobium elkanii TaxID=29448 RepID=UPI0020A1020C|nr:class I SAM-dependent methyltransferase [Bradyrhizobium elkanii]MCP1967493.1 SAM-dependent methyltransferase/tetratricopeptide (TPR) repeat protein [Bradyrhizobium elkanii]MCS3523663.1 SAM-dependent methyltransferase/tetratricopeptide (TPR) repeat protein [Bradyrhizobium elkanii]MCS4071318.1 SAM-dependent methyltransferase/tetratricopeptide (TPR) repeat protein [Bradyrhizobium elkanii]MCS4077950.1 SAM-dependent methyltransferase/tetratricopeptide (TPR) repeat protein [Bradyrhizobium elkanii]